MAGPLATVYEVWQTGSLPHAGGKLGNVASPLWIVAIGAGGLVVGLATFGHHVMRSMGTSLCKLSPTRGFCAELATAMVILIASQFGLPTSSSQCLIGAIVGVGICEGARGVNWKLFGQQVASWAATMVVCVGITGLLFAQGVYTPNKAANTQIVAYKNGLGNMVNTSTRAYNSTLYSYRDAALAGAVPGLDEAAFKANAASVAKLQKSIKDWKNASLPQSTAVSPSSVIKTLQSAVYLTGNSTVNTLGQTEVFPGAQLCNAPGLAAIQSGTKAECKPPQW
jgi:sodium-dependent phosphate transporter